MPKFCCSYAYDVPCYADFYVEAESEEAAEKLINKKLDAGVFSGVSGAPFWENAGENERVFVSGEVSHEDNPVVSLDELLAEAKHQRARQDSSR